MATRVANKNGVDDMAFYNRLDDVFSTWSHVAVLRVLRHSKSGLSGREVAKQAQIHHRACLKTLTVLEDIGLVHRQRGGRDHLFRLNPNHALVNRVLSPLFESETLFPQWAVQFLRKHLAPGLMSLILFGSVARGEDEPDSDFDLCLVLKSGVRKSDIEKRVYDLTDDFRERFGARLAPLYLTEAEFKKKWRQNKSPVVQIAREGRVIAGSSIKGLLGG